MGYNAPNRVITTQPGGAIIMPNGQQLIPVSNKEHYQFLKAGYEMTIFIENP